MTTATDQIKKDKIETLNKAIYKLDQASWDIKEAEHLLYSKKMYKDYNKVGKANSAVFQAHGDICRRRNMLLGDKE
jgi:hypothetical protein